MIRRRRSILDLMREIEEGIKLEIEWMLTQIKEEELYSRCLEPLYTIRDLPDEVVVTIDVPGASKEEMKLRVGERVLYLEAPCNYELVMRRYYRRGATLYKLEIELPAEVDPEGTRTRYKEGVLEVRLPKRERGVRIRVE